MICPKVNVCGNGINKIPSTFSLIIINYYIEVNIRNNLSESKNIMYRKHLPLSGID